MRAIRGGVRGAIFDTARALAFNTALLAAPFAAANLYARSTETDLYIHPAEPQAIAATRTALDRFGARLLPPEDPDTAAWRAFIVRELEDGDAEAARGFALAAPRMLSARDAALLQSMLRPRATDAEILEAALRFLSEGERAAFLQTTGGGLNPRGGAGFVLGDASELSERAASLPPEELVLAGVGAVDGAPPRAAAGASILRAMLRTDALSAAFAGEVERTIAGAYDGEALRAALAAAPQPLGEADLQRAFAAAARPEGIAALHAMLIALGQIAENASPSGAGALLAHASRPDDLDRLTLIAIAGGPRAYAIAKRAPLDARLPDVAQGRLTEDREAWRAAGALTATIAVALAMAGLAVAAEMSPARTVNAEPPAPPMTRPRPPRPRPRTPPTRPRAQPKTRVPG